MTSCAGLELAVDRAHITVSFLFNLMDNSNARGFLSSYLLVRISSRFKSTLDTTVQEASSSFFMPVGSGPRGFVAICCAASGSVS